ncbi:MAG: phosphoribosylformylglycinamidine cyclo-ligase [Ignavibacteria bacterium]|nr:phosphoribosylformylglycinamidine cyclo-ligase [Ignavibacteria bacterium]
MKAYEKSGVNIQKAEELVSKIKIHAKSTFTSNVLSEIGHFGGFFDARFEEYNEPVLISSVDGVGTKLKIAINANRHDTIGQDLVNHCVDDILCAGAKPLFFLDYLAFGKLNLEVAEQIINGFSTACRENGCALIGGETAEMPGLYAENEYDISGTIVGVVEKKKIIDGKRIQPGDVLIGLKSNGLHTNGYSLARKILLENFSLTDYLHELDSTLANELLKVHKSYLNTIFPLLGEFDIKGISHITGGGILGNTKRILPNELKLIIDWNSWERPAIFHLIQKTGNISEDEMREVFNLGIGMIIIISESEKSKLVSELNANGEVPVLIGRVE